MDRQRKWAAYLFALGIFLLLAGQVGNEWFRTYDISRDARKLHKKLLETNRLFDALTSNDTLVNDIISKGFETDFFNLLQQLSFGFLVYKDNHLFFWNRPDFIPPVNISISLPDGSMAAKFPNGYYYVYKKTVFIGMHGYSFLAIYLLKHDYKIRNQYLQSRLNEDLHLPSFLTVSFDSTSIAAPISNPEGRVMFYLCLDPFKFNNTPVLSLVLVYLLGELLVLAAVALFTHYLLYRYGFTHSWIFLVVSLLLFRFVGIYFDFPKEFSKLEIFSPVWYASSAVNKSLADWLMNILVLFAAAYYFFRHAPDDLFTGLKKRYPLVVLLVYYGAALFMTTLLGVIFRSVLVHSNIPFNLNNFLDLNLYSIIGITGLALAMFSFGLVLLKGILLLDDGQLSRVMQITLLSVALLLHSVVLFFFDASYMFYVGSLWMLIFLFFLHDFKKQYSSGYPFTSLMMIITFFAAFSAVHIYHNNNVVEEQRKMSFARNLAQSEDPVAEYLFIDIHQRVAADRIIKNYFLRPYVSVSDIIEHVKTTYLEGYLSKYDTKVYLLNPEGDYLLSDDRDIMTLLNEELIENARETSTENLFFIPRNNGSYSYVSNTIITEGDKVIGTLIIVLNPKVFYRSSIYPELLLEDYILSTRKYDVFSFAEYNDNRLFNKSGSYPYNYRYNLTPDTASGEYLLVKEGNLQHLIYTTGDGKRVVVTSPGKTIIQPITLFSYLFVFYLLFVGIIACIKAIKKYLEEHTYPRRFLYMTLKNKIQLSMILLIVVSFLIIGMVTIKHFISKYSESQRDRLLRKEESIRTQISYAISDNPHLLLRKNMHAFQTSQERGVLNLAVLSEIHAIDINVYDISGQLVNTSQPAIFEKGLLSTVMDPLALRNMLYNYKTQYFREEKIGALEFISLYAPVYNAEGELIAFLNLPYFAKQKELKKEISSFLIALVNVYVLLLVISGFIAYVLSDSITRPLSVLSERFRSIRLGQKNEPIHWDSDDEIGILVNKYNKMIQDLEASAELLARSEREMAWREMAKQIAHEIKNPLTPMKLSIQMLQRAMKEKREDVQQLAEKVTTTLIEQIDNLSQIASEFSTFAKMPASNNELVQLDDIIQSSVNLLLPNEDLEIDFLRPEMPVYIEADKNQLLRVFGNLLKNAQQSIPVGKKGIISIRIILQDHHVMVSVKDNGCGIPVEIQPKVFMPNFTTKSSGMGLGLAITKQIIEGTAGGKIWFETRENEGTTFFVQFPLKQ